MLGSGAGQEVPAAPLRNRPRQLRRADLARRRSGRAARALCQRRDRRRGPGRSSGSSSRTSGTASSNASTGRWSPNATAIACLRHARSARARNVPGRARPAHAADRRSAAAPGRAPDAGPAPGRGRVHRIDRVAGACRSAALDRGRPRRDPLLRGSSARRALDIYRNSIVHYLARSPSFLARGLLDRIRPATSLRADLAESLDLFYSEYHTSRGEVMAVHFDAFIDHFERHGWVERSDGPAAGVREGRDPISPSSPSRRAAWSRSTTRRSPPSRPSRATWAPRRSSRPPRPVRARRTCWARCCGPNRSTTTPSTMPSRCSVPAVSSSRRRSGRRRETRPTGGDRRFDDLPALLELLAAALSAR